MTLKTSNKMIEKISVIIKQFCESKIKNPKKFFIYSMIFLSLSYVGSMIKEIFFPTEITFLIKKPDLYSKSSNLKAKNNFKKEIQMEKIVNELKEFKKKKEKNLLKKEDSIRMQYLYNQFQILKNE